MACHFGFFNQPVRGRECAVFRQAEACFHFWKKIADEDLFPEILTNNYHIPTSKRQKLQPVLPQKAPYVLLNQKLIMMKKYRIELKWGLLFVIMSLAWMLLEKLSGLHSTHIDKHLYLTNLFAIPAIALYVFALREKKRKDYSGTMTYVQGFVSGLIITLVVTLFSPLTQWITSVVITPEFFPNVIEYSLETGYHQSRAEAEAYFSLENYMKQSVIGALLMGLVTSAVVAFFVKSKSTQS